MKKITLAYIISFGLLFCWSIVCAEDGFYVIPVKKRNYAPVEKTGAGDISDYTEDANEDGSLQKGVEWPSPRFTDNEDGTVTDNLTGLIWLKDASCEGAMSWSDALTWSNSLYDGCTDCGGTNNDCGLTDSSGAGDWRVPNLKELSSLIDYGAYAPALPSGHPFTGVISGGGAYYWSSTSYRSPSNAWYVHVGSGDVDIFTKVGDVGLGLQTWVWPVRSGN